MAYFAKLGTGNIVENVISINNSVITDSNGVEQEQLGVDFINKLYNTRDVWKQTSYNNKIRKNYAGIGYQYDQQRDAFIPPKPYQSWVLNEQTCQWQAPVTYPADGKMYSWNELTLSWDLINS
jgi:hypothetical protein